MSFPSFTKSPGASVELDYLFDFASLTNGNGLSDYLEAGETISSILSVTSSSANLTVTSSSIVNAGTAVRVWLDDGVSGETYTVVCNVTTSMARKDKRTIRIICSPT